MINQRLRHPMVEAHFVLLVMKGLRMDSTIEKKERGVVIIMASLRSAELSALRTQISEFSAQLERHQAEWRQWSEVTCGSWSQ